MCRILVIDDDAAEMAITSGAWDYLVKPGTMDNNRLTVNRALAYRDEKRSSPQPIVLKRNAIVGESACLRAALERVAQAAAVGSNALVCGATGTGKELFARAIHANSNRRHHPFVVVDCAALPESLVESVLFGHAKGAFTGAEKERQGLIRQAQGGTLFLDEVGELPITMQKAFLRVCQERMYRPVNSRKEVQVNFRLIAATNRDLEKWAQKGHFRDDLLFRRRSISLHVPPLSRRKGDIRQLALYHISRMSEIYHREVKGFSNRFLGALEKHNWPGNVRELFHTIEESIAIAGMEPTLKQHHLPTRLKAHITRRNVKACVSTPGAGLPSVLDSAQADTLPRIQAYRDMIEHQYLQRLNQLTGGSRKDACRLSGLSRTRLFELLKKHNLGRPANSGPISTEQSRAQSGPPARPARADNILTNCKLEKNKYRQCQWNDWHRHCSV